MKTKKIQNSKKNTPRLLRWSFKILTIKSERNQIANDFEEDYHLSVLENGKARAYLWGLAQIAVSIFPFIRVRFNGRMMILNNYFKTAFRGIRRKPLFSIINISGLAVGVAAALLLVRYISYELSYDDFHQEGNLIYRMEMSDWAGSSGPAGRTALEAFPEVVSQSKINPIFGKGLFSHGKNMFQEDKVYYADNSFLTMFSFEMLKGNPATALKNVDTMVMSESAARKYFGDQDPIGKSITMAGRREFQVTGIIKDIPHNSHFDFEILLSILSLNGDWVETSWYYASFHTYIRLRPGTDITAFETKLQGHLKQLEQQMAKEEHSGLNYHLRPMRDIHLTSHKEFELEENGDKRTITFLGIITIMILLSAWINYINICTAQSLERAKEIGLRKIIGAFRVDVFRQFLFEAGIFNMISVFFSIMLVQLAAPAFRRITGIPSTVRILNSPEIWLAVLIFLSLGVLFSGLYPALVLSSFQPLSIIKGKLELLSGKRVLRKGLVIFQFAVSLILIAGTLTIYRQIQYMKTQDLGIDIDRTIVIKAPGVFEVPDPDSRARQMDVLKTKINTLSGVEGSAASSFVPGQYIADIHGIRRETAPKQDFKDIYILSIDSDFIALYEIPIQAGRNFSRNFRTDLDKAVINQSAASILGFESPEGAVGETVFMEDRPFEIIGVIDNYHQQSLKYDYAPIFLRNVAAVGGAISIRMEPGDSSATLASIKSIWEEVLPGNPFDYFILQEYFNRQYHSDVTFAAVSGIFSTLAIAIGCLGLFGLSTLDIARRTKEIGIRKALGASFSNISVMIIREFFKLVAVAALISLPVAYIIFKNWLTNYAFQIRIGWWFITLPILLISFLAAAAVMSKVAPAAGGSPVKALRYE